MADGSKIEWLTGPDGKQGATWNPITGCSRVSTGCENCYAERLAGTRMKNHPSRKDLTRETRHGPVWTGVVRFNGEWLDQPLRWKRPRRIFVCAHGDLFHENVPDEWIERVFAVMSCAPQHTFLVLTKRSRRMRDFVIGRRRDRIYSDMAVILTELTDSEMHYRVPWPLPNVWAGISAENQDALNLHWPYLRDTPATVRWISAEPLLEPIVVPEGALQRPHGMGPGWTRPVGVSPGLDWIVVGGESGPGARPMHPEWARSLRDQCAAAGVPYFFKQWGEWLPEDQTPVAPRPALRPVKIGGTPAVAVYRIGKRAAGRLLDGRTWGEYPREVE